jgi:xanthine dehydrogenase YagS FAD-binding subunit
MGFFHPIPPLPHLPIVGACVGYPCRLKMHSFEHVDVSDIETGIGLLCEPETEALAGGTDLLGELKRGIRQPRRLVNLKTIPGLGEIRCDNGLRMGALVTLSEIESHPTIPESFPVLAEAVSLTATPQLRNMGTIGGNLCQHPRCWYFRNPLFHCWLKGGSRCFAAAGENKFHAILGAERCHAVHPSDPAPALVALDASLVIAGPGGNREVSLEAFYRQPRPDQRRMTVLEPGELIREIHIPMPRKGAQGIYLKVMERRAWSFALVSLAAQLSFEAGVVTEARLVLGGVASTPWRAGEAERVLVGRTCSEAAMELAGEAAVAGAKPLRTNQYKVLLLKGLFKNLVEKIGKSP